MFWYGIVTIIYAGCILVSDQLKVIFKKHPLNMWIPFSILLSLNRVLILKHSFKGAFKFFTKLSNNLFTLKQSKNCLKIILLFRAGFNGNITLFLWIKPRHLTITRLESGICAHDCIAKSYICEQWIYTMDCKSNCLEEL